MKFYKSVLIFFILLFTSFQSTYSSMKNFSGEEEINTKIYEEIYPAIVSIDANIPNGFTTGTGCIISSDGYILTSSHVVKNTKNIEVTTNSGQVYPAKIYKISNNEQDLAIIKIEPTDNLKSIKLGNSSDIKVGQRVLAIGNPFGFQGTLTTGIISRIDYAKNKIQTDAAINPGSSGGPIVNINGEVIGISQSIYNPDHDQSNIGIGFAIPVNEAKPLLNMIKTK